MVAKLRTEGKLSCPLQNEALLFRSTSYQKVTSVGNGMLNQQGLNGTLAPMDHARNRP